jgi:DNA-binding CsgD family transcriptional regulator
MDTIEVEGWQGRLGQGLAPRQLMATIYATLGFTKKEIARHMGCSPETIKAQLETARLKLDNQPTVRSLCREAMRRGIISQLVLLLCISMGFGSMTDRPTRPVRAPKVAVRIMVRQEVA